MKISRAGNDALLQFTMHAGVPCCPLCVKFRLPELIKSVGANYVGYQFSKTEKEMLKSGILQLMIWEWFLFSVMIFWKQEWIKFESKFDGCMCMLFWKQTYLLYLANCLN